MPAEKYELLNDRQREAVFHTEGPLLILAGAGAGKTRVLTHRIAYLIEEENVPAYNILAITFTNKAAEEMKNRVQSMVKYGDSVWVATFHSTCVRILRRHINYLGYDTDFTIYDTDDQKTLLRHVIKDMNLDPKMFKERAMASLISSCKNEMQSPEDMLELAGSDFRLRKEALIYEEYQKRMKSNNALDFDDLLLLTVQLFRENPEVLRYYQNRFQYIMVDEYQDTNHVQFEFIYYLAKAHGNLCVVGDDDQSIYGFRGADIRNILEFEEKFQGTRVIKLEQNYRSTTNILNCANAVISHNEGRKDKHLWSDLGEGEMVTFKEYENGYEEAEDVIRRISREVKAGGKYSDYAILYRTNAQSRAFEEKCVALNIPYRLVGGVNFYQRAEIKDILAYLKTVSSGKDDIAVQRIINVPRRGIGQTTIDRLLSFSTHHDMSLYEAIHMAADIPEVKNAVKKLQVFDHMIGVLREKSQTMSFADLIREIIETVDYESTLDDLDEEQREQKKENIDELISKAADFEANWEGDDEPRLSDFLEEIALVADVDSVMEGEERVLLMTLHGSKGLEFPVVYLAGMEDGLFPSYMSMESGDPKEIEEERRLCYVGITRAMRKLHLSAARMRTMHGDFVYNKVSRFVKEIPRYLIEREDTEEERRENRSRFKFGGYTGEEYGGSGRSYGGSSRYDSYGSGSVSYADRSLGREPVETKVKVSPKATFGKTFEVKKPASAGFSEGDRIKHIRFGEGTVLSVEEEPKDFKLTILFDVFGQKVLRASFVQSMMEKIE